MNPDLEQRVAELEAKIARYEAVFAAFAAGPGKKLAGMFGVKIPELTP